MTRFHGVCFVLVITWLPLFCEMCSQTENHQTTMRWLPRNMSVLLKTLSHSNVLSASPTLIPDAASCFETAYTCSAGLFPVIYSFKISLVVIYACLSPSWLGARMATSSDVADELWKPNLSYVWLSTDGLNYREMRRNGWGVAQKWDVMVELFFIFWSIAEAFVTRLFLFVFWNLLTMVYLDNGDEKRDGGGGGRYFVINYFFKITFPR